MVLTQTWIFAADCEHCVGYPKVAWTPTSHKTVCPTARSHLAPRRHIPTHRSHIRPEVCDSLLRAAEQIRGLALHYLLIDCLCKSQRKNTKVAPSLLITMCTIYYLVLLITYSSH